MILLVILSRFVLVVDSMCQEDCGYLRKLSETSLLFDKETPTLEFEQTLKTFSCSV